MFILISQPVRLRQKSSNGFNHLRGHVKGQVELFMLFAVRVDAYMLLPANLGVVAPVIPSGIFPWQFLLELDVFL